MCPAPFPISRNMHRTGAALPAFAVVFGNLVNKFGTYQTDPDQLVSKLNPVVLDFVYVGIATFFASYMEIYFFMLTSEGSSRT